MYVIWFWNGKQFKGARGFKLIMDGETAVVSKTVGELSLGFSGYQYRIHGENSKLISWVCVKDSLIATLDAQTHTLSHPSTTKKHMGAILLLKFTLKI